MGAYIKVVLHNALGHPQWFTVTDNTAGATVFDDNLDTDATSAPVKVAVAANGRGDITYVPRGYVGTRRDDLDDGSQVDMS
jgi:hypothetical protein